MIIHTEGNRFNNFVKGIGVIIAYFLINIYKGYPLAILHIDYNSLTVFAKELYTFSIELVTLTVIFIIFEKEFKKAWADLKKNHMKYFSENFKYYVVGFVIMYSANFLITILGGGISGNETIVREQLKLAPIFSFVSSIFIAPVVEESIFRLSFRSIFKSDLLFVLVSGLIFGSLHLIAGVDTSLTLLYLIAYSGFGFVFSYMMVKTNNIFVPIGFHMMHNGILVTIQLIHFFF